MSFNSHSFLVAVVLNLISINYYDWWKTPSSTNNHFSVPLPVRRPYNSDAVNTMSDVPQLTKKDGERFLNLAHSKYAIPINRRHRSVNKNPLPVSTADLSPKARHRNSSWLKSMNVSKTIAKYYRPNDDNRSPPADNRSEMIDNAIRVNETYSPFDDRRPIRQTNSDINEIDEPTSIQYSKKTYSPKYFGGRHPLKIHSKSFKRLKAKITGDDHDNKSNSKLRGKGLHPSIRQYDSKHCLSESRPVINYYHRKKRQNRKSNRTSF